MKKILLSLALLVWSVVSAAATCTGPAVMHDFPGTSFNMSLATVPDGNCGSNVALPTWAGGTLGAMANYGTSPGAVLVPGVNAFITNTPPVTQSGTWTVQPGNTANSTAWLVTGTGGTFPITAASLPLPTGAATSALQPTNAAQASTTSGQTGPLVQCATTTSAPSYTTAQTDPFSCDLTGSLRVNVTSAVGLAQGSTTAGQTGSLIMGAVTTSAPSYTTAQTSPLSVTPAGDLRAIFSNTSINVGTITTLPSTPSGSNLIGKVGIDQTTPGTTNGVQDASTSATGSAPPSKAAYIAANTGGATGGLMQGLITCNLNVTYDASTSGSTQLVALASGQKIYVCGYTITTGGTATNIKLIYGTGTACATGSNNLTPAYQLGVNSGIVEKSTFWDGMVTATANALCINTSAGNAVQAKVSYAQF